MPVALEIDSLYAGYGDASVLRGVSLKVDAQSCVALIARNGVGKSTLASAIAGWLPRRANVLRLDDRDLRDRRPYHIARAGLGFVPQGRRLFPSLTVQENLDVAAGAGRAEALELVRHLFPILWERRGQTAGTLSGGQQQMLAIGRALIKSPSLLLLDEPTEGLARNVIKELLDQLLVLKKTGMSMLLLEQRLDFALQIADVVLVMTTGGRLVFEGTPAELLERPDVQEQYIGLSMA